MTTEISVMYGSEKVKRSLFLTPFKTLYKLSTALLSLISSMSLLFFMSTTMSTKEEEISQDGPRAERDKLTLLRLGRVFNL